MRSGEGDEDEMEMLMAEILDGTRSVDDADVRAVFARSPELRERLAALRAVQQQLDTSGRLARASIERALDVGKDGGPAGWDRAVEDFAQSRRQGTRPQWLLRRLGFFGMAAAAILVVTALWWAQRPSEDAPPQGQPKYYLDGDAKQLGMAPIEFYAPDDRWTWTQPIPADGKAELLFFDAADPSTIDPFLRVTVREGFGWQANAKQQLEFVPHVRWELRMRDAAGVIRASGSVSPTRR